MQSELAELFLKIIIPALVKTLYMVLATTVSATALGFILAVIIVVTDKDGLRPNKYINEALSTLVNVVRSFPFIILMVTIIPFTRLVMGTSIGEKAAIVPLTVAAAPFVARIIENALKEVDKSLIEVARSFGASDMQIIFKIMVVEAVPAITSGITLAVISILGASAVAGIVGAGGLGAVALTYGYQNFNDKVMYGTVLVIIILVQMIQTSGNFLYRKLK